MTDEELLIWLRVEDTNLTDFAADRIEELLAERKKDHANINLKADFIDKTINQLAEAEAKLAKAMEALAPLAAIADAFDANELDDEARKFWGQHSFNTTPHEDIELYQGRGGRQLLTLANCMFARATLKKLKEMHHMTDEELIARLRKAREKRDEFEAVMLSGVAADRIEALIAERDAAREYAGEVRKREMAAEDARISATDKLAKAVEEAEKYQRAFAAQSRKLQAVLHIEGVRTTLAEIKG